MRPGADPGPLVDVRIPTIGPAPFLSEAVASVVAQSLESWRLVVSEDEPGVDHSRALVAAHLDDPRIRFTDEHAGRNASRHVTRLIRQGTAPYVAILDNDDRWGPDFLARRVRFLERHPECGFVFSRSRVIDAQGRDLGANQPRLEEGVHDSRSFIAHVLRWGNVVTAGSVLVRRSAYEAVGSAYDPSFVVGYDYEMWLRLAARSPVGYLDLADFDYRLHPDQATQAPADFAERVRLLDQIEAQLAQALPDLSFDSHHPRTRRVQNLLGAALDAGERGDRNAARGYLRRAFGRHRIVAIHPAVPAVLVAGALGEPGSKALRLGRSWVRKHPSRRR